MNQKFPVATGHHDDTYLQALSKIYLEGEDRTDRTGTGTRSLFGDVQMKFDLRNSFPLLTTKFVSFHSIKHELIWMLRGDTNIRYLKQNRVKIWDDWVQPETAQYRMLEWGERLRRLTTEQLKNFDEVTELMKEDGRSQRYILNVQSELLAKAGVPEKELIAGELGPVYEPKSYEELYNEVAKSFGAVNINWQIMDGNQEIENTVSPFIHDNYGTTVCIYFRQPVWEFFVADSYAETNMAALVFVAGYQGISHKKLVAGELGPVYGSQWRKWPDTRVVYDKKYEAEVDAYEKRGFTRLGKVSIDYDFSADVIYREIDQIAMIEDQLKNNPDSRRIILSGWNVAMIEEMALPPCHTLAQWYVSTQKDDEGKNYLDCKLYMR